MKKNIRVSLSIVFLLFSLTTFAQLRFGARVGINSPQINFIDNGYPAKHETMYSLQAGLVTELNITDMFFVQSGLHFMQRGGAIILPNQINVPTTIQTKVNSLHLPIEAGVRYYWKENTSIIGTLGGFGEYGLSAKEIAGTQTRVLNFGNEDYNLNPYTLGVSGSFGLEFQNTIQLKVHYYYGFTRVYNLANTTSNNKGISLTLAYMFGH